ncbi:MAG: hypothetical protein H7839_00520 [Magnetococcus sp. YQC-5]
MIGHGSFLGMVVLGGIAMRDGSSTVLSSLISWVWTLVLVGAAIGTGVLVTREFDVVAVSKWASLPTFLSVPLQRQGDNAIMATLAGVVSGFLLLFLAGYVVQALMDGLRLGWVARSLDGLDPGQSPPLSQRSWIYYPLFTRLWREFSQSLRQRSRLDPVSGQRIIDYYATLPAEMVFSHQALVDVPMRVEFFRHLPGILTGSGIVSTFAGILMGLTGFDPSVGADHVTKELQVLFMGVSTAFTASFFAIVTAILVTVLEKFLLHWRYAQVAALQGRLNQRFGMDEAMSGVDGHSADGEMLALKMTGLLSRLETVLTQGHEEAKASRDVLGALPEWANQWRNDTVERLGQVLSAHLEAQVAPLIRAVEGVVSRETHFREEMNTHRGQWSALEARLEQYQERQLAFLEGETKRRQEADSTQEARMNGLVGTLEHHFGRHLTFMEGDAVRRQEGVSTLEARLGQLGSVLETHLGRQVILLEKEAVQRQEHFAAQEVRLSQLGSALDTQLKRQVTLLENEGVRRQEGLSTLEARLSQMGSALDTQLKRQVTLLENEAVRRQEGLSTLEARLGQLGATIETQLKRQVALFEKEAVQRQEGVSTLEARLGQVGTTLDTQLKRQVVLLEKESVQRQEEVSKLDAHMGHLENTLDTQLGRQVVLLEKESVQRQEGVSRLEERLVQLGNTLDMQLGRQVGLLEQESRQRQEGVSRLEERLTTLGSMLAGHFERQVAGLEEEGTQQGEMISLLGRLNEQGAQTTDAMRILREDALVASGQLQKEVAEILERIPSSQEVALVLRDANQEVRERIEAQFMQLAGQVEAVQGEIMGRIASTAKELSEVSAGGRGRLMELFGQRMDEVSTGLAKRLQELSERIVLERQALEEQLRELQGKVEHAVLTDEKGMVQLFGQMGQEMERMRIQLRESVGEVVVQTREITVQGDEQIKVMMGGMSEEFNGALQAMAEARRELDQNREAVLVERLVKQTARQAEEIKLAVLDGLEVTTKRLSKQIRKTDEEQSRTQEESAHEVVNVIAQRMETAFGGVSEELAEMRTRLVSEQRAMEQSLHEWVKEASQSSLEESKVLAQRIMEVQVKLDERHHGVIGVIDQLGDGLASDLEQLRDGLYHKNEESSRQVEAHLTELGNVLEGVVTSLGREQTVFIEMLGERLDTLRRRLHVK